MVLLCFFFFKQKTAYEIMPSLVGSEMCIRDSIKAVRSRKKEDLNADILEGHLSSALCHTGNISHRLGQQASPGEIRDAIKANPAALETLGRFEEHLARNQVDLKLDKATMGAFLQMDPKTEKFIGNAQADALLTRNY